MTGCLFVAYIVIVAGFGRLFPEQDNTLIAILTISVIAFLFRPLRVRLQRAINRLLYGERDDPYAVIARLGQRIDAVVVPGDVLPGIVETLAQALKLPFVAIALNDRQTFTTAVAHRVQDERNPLIQLSLLLQ